MWIYIIGKMENKVKVNLFVFPKNYISIEMGFCTIDTKISMTEVNSLKI